MLWIMMNFYSLHPYFGDGNIASAESEDLLMQVYYNPTRSRRKNRWPNVLKYFAWKPWEVIRETFQVTKQYAVQETRLPVCRHFQTCFPALNARCLDEDYATDRFNYAQLFVGMNSMFISLNGMKREYEFPSVLMDFIQSFGASNCQVMGSISTA
jgi:hypothetical protein